MPGVLLLAIPAQPRAQAPDSGPARITVTVLVEDREGLAIGGATVSDAAGAPLGTTASDGRASVPCATPCMLRIHAPGFSDQAVAPAAVASGGAAATVRLDPAPGAAQVTVTAYRAPLGDLESPVTTRTLSRSALATSAVITLDDRLRQLPGVELFRRSSSLVANPTSQGVSVRGLGSTSASRTLVTQDDVPLNDPIGGWIHWQEQPELAIESAELVRGGASDLYGSSAIGGVLNMITARPLGDRMEVRSSYGGEGTYDASALAEARRGPWGVLASGGTLGTDGYIQEAPWERGPIDTPSNVHSQNGILVAEHADGPLRLFVRGSMMNEARGNGTPFQVNGTRLFRYATGADWQSAGSATAALRLYGSTEHYRQTFSSIGDAPTPASPGCSLRCGETPTRLALVPANELGASAHWSQPLGPGLLLLAGADAHDVRIWDRELVFASGQLTTIGDHQRDSGAYLQLLWSHRAWTVTASGRMDWFENYDGSDRQLTGGVWVPTPEQPASRQERIFDPRLGLSRRLLNHWAVQASGFRAFRSPTPSELYRSTQVGSQLTLPNDLLLSERATGWEAGLAAEHPWGTVRASYFLTEVNRPIVAVTMGQNLLMRENLGQIESRGVALDLQLSPRRWLQVDGGYQYAHATVSRGPVDHGNWIPEVARNMASMNLRASRPRLGTLSLQGRLSGRQYDDDANQFLLHGYLRLDAYASRGLNRRLELFAAGENLLDRTIEVGKTPTTTLGAPRTARIGVDIRIGRAD